MARHYLATARREVWIKEHGPCAVCSTWDSLQVDHIDPRTKTVPVSEIWGWSSEVRRNTELDKCQVLCVSCHRDKTNSQLESRVEHGTLHMYNSPRYKCRCALCRAAWSQYLRDYRKGRRLRTD